MLITPEEYYEVTKKAMAEGYTAIKVDPLWFSDQPNGGGDWKVTGPLERKVLRTGYERVKAMREAGGEDLDIIVELHSLTDTVSAVEFGRALEDLNIFYYEEPTHPLNPGNLLEIHRQVRIPIATGERVYTRWGYRQILENHAVQVIQPDLCLCGGLTEAKKICDMAHTYDCAVQIHVCGSPISKAAALQIEAAIPISSSTNIISARSILKAAPPVCTTISPKMATMPYRIGRVSGRNSRPRSLKDAILSPSIRESPIAHKRFKSQRPSAQQRAFAYPSEPNV